MSAKCQEHYPAEMDEAINAGACPVCLRRELAEARAENERLRRWFVAATEQPTPRKIPDCEERKP